ncbi:MAG TPA: DUF4328 domain-containing protein, partial [Capsulimonadaceae bacterium]
MDVSVYVGAVDGRYRAEIWLSATTQVRVRRYSTNSEQDKYQGASEMTENTELPDTWPPKPATREGETIVAARIRLVDGYKSQLLATSRITAIAWCVLAIKLVFLPVPDAFAAFEPINFLKPILGVVYFLLSFALGVLYLKWVYDIAKNADVLSGNPSTTSPSVSVIAYFVPVLCLFMPYSNMKATWDRVAAGVSLKEYKAGTIIGWWWAVWITESVIGLGVNSNYSGMAWLCAVVASCLWFSTLGLAVVHSLRLSGLQGDCGLACAWLR